jgi:hypothetical protein
MRHVVEKDFTADWQAAVDFDRARFVHRISL